jgi:hypothetical protein
MASAAERTPPETPFRAPDGAARAFQSQIGAESIWGWYQTAMPRSSARPRSSSKRLFDQLMQYGPPKTRPPPPFACLPRRNIGAAGCRPAFVASASAAGAAPIFT